MATEQTARPAARQAKPVVAATAEVRSSAAYGTRCNFSQAGYEVPLPADAVAGIPQDLGADLGVAIPSESTAETASPPTGRISGVHHVPNPDGTAFAQGTKVAYDATNNKAVATTTGDFELGPAFTAYVAGKQSVAVLLNGRPG